MAAQYLLDVPSKATKSVDFTERFPRFIANNYDDEPGKFKEAIKELNVLRESCVIKSPDKHETGLDLIIRYHDQLVAIENKLPITENQIHIKFNWYDAFSTGLLSSKNASLVSGVYERCCVLFNIAALQSQIAKSQNFDSDEGLKNAAKHFQGAAGTFQHLREQIFSYLQSAPTPDLSAESTTALSTLMLAQAQEVFVYKAYKDKIKTAVLAKLAMQCSDLYNEAFSNMQVSSVRGQWDKGWLSIVSGKGQYFHAVAQHHMGLVAQANKSFGEAVARMKKASDLLKDADRKGDSYFRPYEVTSTLKRDLEAVEKDNNFIYNDRVPDFGTLEPPGRASVAKNIQFQSPASNFLDLFSSLVPLPVSRALSAYNGKKDSLVNGELDKLRNATSALNENLAGKNLPAAIEDISGDQVPDSIKEKSQQIREQGGLQSLEEKMFSLPELLQRNREILDETQRILDEEERDDRTLKDRFKEKWNRTGSKELTQSIRSEVAKFQGIVETATKADLTVKDKFEVHRRAMATLTKNEPDLEASLPKAGAMAAMKAGSPSIQELRQLMEDVKTIKAEREVLEQQLKEPVSDITPKFLQALKDLGDVDEEAISEAHLRSEYGKYQEQVTDSIQRQESLEKRINTAYLQFQQETEQHGTSERDNVLKDLAAGFDAYMELTNNLAEGSKFYNDLTPLLVKIQNKVSDFVFARTTEKDDLLKELQKDIAGAPKETAPSTPQYQQEQRQPPARPPPPHQAPPPQAPPPQAPPPQASYYQPPPSQAPGYAPPYGQPPPQAPGYAPPYGQPQPGYYQPPPHGYAPPPAGGYAPPPPHGGYQQPYYQQPPPPPHGQPYYNPGQYGQPYQPPPNRR